MRTLIFLLNVLQLVHLQSATQQQAFRFANHYESHMVLQRAPHRAVIWGYGESDQDVTLHMEGNRKLYKAKVQQGTDNSNTWRIELDPMPAGGPYKITATSSSSNSNARVTVILDDVLFGDVWLCGGQSNMKFPVKMAFNGWKEINMVGKYSNIRLFTVQRYFTAKPIDEFEKNNILLHWSVASKDSIAAKNYQYFSAICWMYGRRLYDLYKVPIGLVSSNFGGTFIEAWSSNDALNKCYDSSIHRYKRNQNTATYLWNAMIHPLLKTTIFGAIWYQGENNAFFHTNTYNCTFPAMINDWRRKWYRGTNGNTDRMFPFGFVQIGSFNNAKTKFPLIRWLQTTGYGYAPNEKLRNTFMAVAMDLPDEKSPTGAIHPRDKTTVAERLVLGARAIAYNETSVYHQGPIVDSCSRSDGTKGTFVKIVYKNLGGGRISVRSNKGFEILTGTTKPSWIAVNITRVDQNSVTLLTTGLTAQAVRYAWESRPCDYKKCAIYSVVNKLPAPPYIHYFKRQRGVTVVT